MATGSILVVDDEYGVRSGIRAILEMDGYDVEDAADGVAALAQIERRDFDVALLDYRLPDTDGLSLLHSMRERGCEAHGLHDHGLRQHRHGGRGDAAGRGLLSAQAVHARRPARRCRDAAEAPPRARRGRAAARRARGQPDGAGRREDADALAGQLAARRRARGQSRGRRGARQPGDDRSAGQDRGRGAHEAGAGAAWRGRAGAPLRAAGGAGQGPHRQAARHRRTELHGEHRHLPRRRRRRAGSYPDALRHQRSPAPGHGEVALHPHDGARAALPAGLGQGRARGARGQEPRRRPRAVSPDGGARRRAHRRSHRPDQRPALTEPHRADEQG